MHRLGLAFAFLLAACGPGATGKVPADSPLYEYQPPEEEEPDDEDDTEEPEEPIDPELDKELGD